MMNSIAGFTSFRSFGLLCIRIALGSIMIAHGMMKWGMWNKEPNEQLSAGMLTVFKILSISEPLGGLALIIGFLTLFASIGLLISMTGALYMKIFVMHAPFINMKGAGWEFDILIIASLLCLVFNSAGKISLDWLMFKKQDPAGN
jgi:putative oxidoreductase